MSTRRADSNAALSYEKYMSAPEFADLRPIPGNVVLAKALLYKEASMRELAFFLQAMSMRPGGLNALADSLVSKHPKSFREGEASKQFSIAQLADSMFETKGNAVGRRCLDRAKAEDVAGFLVELAINPKVSLSEIVCPFFNSLGSALTDFKAEWEAAEARDLVITTAGKMVQDTLHQALRMRRMVVLEGDAGAGKSTNAKAWCAARPGRVRYVTLSGLTNRTTFFQKIATSIGLATCQRKAVELQGKIEDFFARSGMMLVIDEAHHAWPQTLRVETAPELIDWINTALVNQGVPVALITTPQFAMLKDRVEKRTGWTSNQFIHRVYRYRKLPEKPTRDDVAAVTRSLLSAAWDKSEERWKAAGHRLSVEVENGLVAYAIDEAIPFAIVAGCIDEARELAREAGRTVVSTDDLCKALKGGQIPSDLALARAFSPTEKKGRSGRPEAYTARTKSYVEIPNPASRDARRETTGGRLVLAPH